AIEAVPNSLRKQYDLAEASESCAASLRALREEYIGTLLEEAEMFCAPKHKVALEEDFIGHGVLTLCYAHKAFAEESKAEEVAELIQQLKGDHVPVEAENQLDEAQESLLRDLVDAETAAKFHLAAVNFFAAHRNGPEPKAPAIFGLLSAAPADLLEWAGVSPARKYRSIRAKTWPRDVGRAGTLAYLAFAAHLKILQDVGEDAPVTPEHGDEGEAQEARGEKRGRPEPAEPVLKPAAARKYCQGFDNIQCAFGPGGERAQPHGPAQCLFCSPQRLEEALGDPARAVAARKRFAQLTPQMQAVALARVREPGYRNWLAAVAAQPQAEVEEAVAGKPKYCQGYNGIQCSCGAGGKPARPNGPTRCLFCNPERLQEALNAPLSAAAARRRFVQLSPEAQEEVLGRVLQPEHRDQLAAAQPLLEAEEPACRPYRRRDQSWRGAAPYTSEEIAARYSAGAAAWEEVLRQRQAVAEPEVAEVEYRAKVVDDRRKSLNMMQQAVPRLPRGAEVSNEDPLPKAASTRLAANLQLWAEFNSWQICDSCGALQPRDLAPAGLRGLLRPHCDARHCIFCRSARPAPRPQPPPDALRGLSLDVRQALQPAEPDFGPVIRSRDQFGRDLFLERQHCLTWARLQSSSRQARGSERSTLEERLNFDPLGEASPPEEATGLKRSYMALVLSPILDFSLSYELLHFAFDLGLWTDLGAKRNLNLGTPLRLLLKGHSFSSEYWRDMHRALVDLTRQKGYPPIFATHSPLEWSWPNHCHILDAMRKGRLQHEVYEALHQAHLLTQIGKNFVVGGEGRERRGHEEELQLLQRQRLDGSEASVVSFLRLEFQDGKRRDPSQDYHGSGRAHAHQLVYVGSERRDEDVEALRLELCVQATLEVEPASLRGFVVASQLDGNGKTPFPVHEGASHYNSNIRAYEFLHNAEDHSKGVRGYFSPLMEVTKCHQDVQVDQRGQQNYAAYTAKYAPKFSDSMEEELLNDDADANSIAASVLSRYKPCVPEMALQLFGSVFRQWHIGTHSGGRRALNVPTPDVDPAPKVVELYESSAWRADNMTLLDYLRKTNDQGEIAGWLKAQWRSAGQPDTLQNFANAYRPQGEKVVACGVGSRLRDKFYGQWLLLNVPFRTRSALLLPEIAERVPPTDRWLATCVFCPQAEARQVWDSEAAIEEDMLLEGHGRLHRQEVLGYFRAQSALARQYMSGALQKPAPRPAVTRPGRTHFLPIQNRYAELIATGAKTVEGRLNCGVAALVKAGDRLRLGPVHCKVTEINNYTSFEEMLRSTPWQAAVPDVSTLQEALEVYHSFANYEDLAQRCGVRAFHVQLEDAETNHEAPAWNTEQSRWLRIMEEDLARAAAVHFASGPGKHLAVQPHPCSGGAARHGQDHRRQGACGESCRPRASGAVDCLHGAAGLADAARVWRRCRRGHLPRGAGLGPGDRGMRPEPCLLRPCDS
ncbi:unnamed protein product, partial [Effrenium voratum]